MPIHLRTDTSAAEHNLRKSWPFAPNPVHFADCNEVFADHSGSLLIIGGHEWPSGSDISFRDGGTASTGEALLCVSMETNEQRLTGQILLPVNLLSYMLQVIR
jgi:hypothetical protein